MTGMGDQLHTLNFNLLENGHKIFLIKNSHLKMQNLGLEKLTLENVRACRILFVENLRLPVEILLEICSICWKIAAFAPPSFYARKQNASRVSAIIWASVRPSVRPSHS